MDQGLDDQCEQTSATRRYTFLVHVSLPHLPLITDRLSLRKLTLRDAEFIFELVNDPDWIRYIGDRGVRTLEDAQEYMKKGPMTMYEKHGFGLYLVEVRETGKPIGLSGLLKRDALEDVDIGFAFLPSARGHGYAREAARAVIEEASSQHKLRRLVAITSLDNESSIKLLEKEGFRFERLLTMPGDVEPVKLFVWKEEASN